jgi:MFS family permease
LGEEIKKKTLFDVLQLGLKNSSDVIAYLFIPLIATLFFIEAFRTYVPGIYIAMFHVVFQDEGWIGSLMLLLTLLLFFVPLFTNYLCKKFGQKKMYLVSIFIIALVRLIIACHLSSIIETVLAGVIIAFFGIFISIFLKRLMQNDLNLELKAKVSIFSIAFIGAFLLDSLIRTIGFSLDISLVTSHLNPELWPSLQYLWLIVQVPLSVLLILFSIRTNTIIIPQEKMGDAEELRNEPLILTACGLGMFFFLLFNLFLYPNAIAQYTGTLSAIIGPFLTASIILVLLYLLFAKTSIVYNIKINLCFNLILLLALAAFLFLGKASPYPIGILMALSVAIMFLNTHLLIINMSTTRKPGIQISQFSKIMTYGLLFLILMTFLHDFTTDHAFTIEAFQGFGPLILFIGGCLFALMTLLAHVQLNQFEKGRVK